MTGQRMNNTLLCIMFFWLISPQKLNAQVNIPDVRTVHGSKDLPIELNLLLNSLQANKPQTYEKVRLQAFNIERYARALKREDIFLIGKIEVYRILLKTNGSSTKVPIDGNGLKTFQLAEVQVSDPFFKWLLKSLIQDTQMLLDSTSFKEYILLQNASVTDLNKYRRVIKKSQLLQNWVQKITPEADDFKTSFANLMIPKMEEALKNVENSIFLLSNHSNLNPPTEPLIDEKELKLFSIKINVSAEPKRKEKVAVKDKSVEDILGPLTTEETEVLPAPSAENWLMEENSPPELENLPKPSNDADWLQDF